MKVKTIDMVIAIGFCLLLFHPVISAAHCDTLDGPVVKAARIALEKGDVTPVLKWVKKDQEKEIQEAFKKTLIVRAKGPEANELADMYFFETLVRLHRAGERASFTGLKPAGAVEPIVAEADKALETGSVDTLTTEMSKHLTNGVKERFDRALEKKKHMNESVDAGREYVEAYVEYVHYIESLHKAVVNKDDHHHEGSEGGE
jgi:hypothetical protein